jgi:hypothetical protein
MCALGKHQEGEDVRPPRRGRHLDGSVTAAVAKTPRARLMENIKTKAAELRAEVADSDPQQIEMEQFLAQYEPLPPGVDQLPDHVIDDTKRPYWVDMP